VIVLDTNAWLFWLHEPSRLSRRARAAITRATARDAARVSVISVWEVALKSGLRKLTLPLAIDEWLERARSYPGLGIEPLLPQDAIASTRLPGELHRDPADRFIVSLALRLDAPLVTADEKLRAYPHVDTVW
jgi:PIN domain nuclease of toxin-antitoxin system